MAAGFLAGGPCLRATFAACAGGFGNLAAASGRVYAGMESWVRVLSGAAAANTLRGADAPNTSWAKSRISAAENRYFTLSLSKIPIIFRTFADMSAKTPESGLRRPPAGFSGATKIGKKLQKAYT